MEISKRVNWISFFLIAVLAVAISCNDDDDDGGYNGGNPDTGSGEAVIEQISFTNLVNVDLGQLAFTEATDSTVRSFAQLVASEAQKAQDDLDSVAEARNVDLPSDLSDEHQELRDNLDSLTGFAFDSAYIQSQIMIHTEAKNLLESIADTTTDQDLLSYVNTYLPGINLQLMKADSIADFLFNSGGGSDTTGMGNDTTGVGNDTTGMGNDTTGVGNDTTGVGNDTTGVGNDTTGLGNDTTGVGNDTTGADGGNDGTGVDGNTDGDSDGTGDTDGTGDPYGLIDPKGTSDRYGGRYGFGAHRPTRITRS